MAPYFVGFECIIENKKPQYYYLYQDEINLKATKYKVDVIAIRKALNEMEQYKELNGYDPADRFRKDFEQDWNADSVGREKE